MSNLQCIKGFVGHVENVGAELARRQGIPAVEGEQILLHKVLEQALLHMHPRDAREFMDGQSEGLRASLEGMAGVVR